MPPPWAQAQELERLQARAQLPEPEQVPKQLGPQAQRLPPSPQWPHRTQVPQWLASSYHHASIARTRLSKPNR